MATSPMAEKRMIRICSVFTLMWVLVFLLGSETPIAFKRTRGLYFLYNTGFVAGSLYIFICIYTFM